MPETVERFTVFLASPGDVPTERKAVEAAIEEINRTFGEPEGFVLTLKRWETHTRPARAPTGGSSQDVIDAQIGDYDIFVGLMWTRFGTPTKKAGSGTEQEYDAARKAGKRRRKHPLRVMFYFRSGTAKVRAIDPDQLKAVRAFKAKVFRDHLAREYDTPSEFARLIREHLIHEARGLLSRKRTAAPKRQTAPKAGAAPGVAKRSAKSPATAPTRATPAPKPSVPKRSRGPKALPIVPVRKLLTEADRKAFAERAYNSVFQSVSRTAAAFARAHEGHGTLKTTQKGKNAFEVKGQVEGYRPAHFRIELVKDQWAAQWGIRLLEAWHGWSGKPQFQTVVTVRTADDDYTPRLEDDRTYYRSSPEPALTAKVVAEDFWKRINDALNVRL